MKSLRTFPFGKSRTLAVLLPLATGLFVVCAPAAPKDSAAPETLAQALTFHASFDRGADADFALGDRRFHTAPSISKRGQSKHGLPETGEVVIAKDEGRFGDALRFAKKKSPLVFFQAEKNVAYSTQAWSGTVSFWLSLDPETDLEPGFTDPIQITPRAWNDGAFFVEFGKDEKPRHFRLGAYADFKIWNPQNRDWNAIPFSEKPLVSVEKPPFGRGQWTHVVFTFEHFNTGRPDGVARLYLNGQPQGSLSPRQQTFTWDPSQTLVMLGLSYIGLFDELSLFNRALTAGEIATLHRLEKGVRPLLK